MAKQTGQRSSAFDALVSLRKPTANGQTKQSNSQTSKQLDVGKAKSVAPDYLKFTTYIRKTTHKAVKLKALEQGRELSDVVEELLAGWLSKQSP